METPLSPLSSERSRGICSAPLGPPRSSFLTPTLKQKCHPDRSVAKWRDLLFRRSQQRMWNGNTPLPFVIRAKSRDLQCAPRTSQIFLPNPNPQTEVSSQPKRSEVEGPMFHRSQ